MEHPITLKWAEVRQLPIRQVTLDIHCVTRWSKLDTAWEGPDRLPSLAEIREPRRWIERVATPAA